MVFESGGYGEQILQQLLRDHLRVTVVVSESNGYGVRE
jgi:hypothetical protein